MDQSKLLCLVLPEYVSYELDGSSKLQRTTVSTPRRLTTLSPSPSSRISKSQNLTSLSAPPLTIPRPSGRTWTAQTGPECALYVDNRVEAAMSYSRSSPDLVPSTTYEVSALHTISYPNSFDRGYYLRVDLLEETSNRSHIPLLAFANKPSSLRSRSSASHLPHWL